MIKLEIPVAAGSELFFAIPPTGSALVLTG